jgi:hypothetical protein
MIGLTIIVASIITGLVVAFLLSPLIVGILRMLDPLLNKPARLSESQAAEVPHIESATN